MSERQVAGNKDPKVISQKVLALWQTEGKKDAPTLSDLTDAGYDAHCEMHTPTFDFKGLHDIRLFLSLPGKFWNIMPLTIGDVTFSNNSIHLDVVMEMRAKHVPFIHLKPRIRMLLTLDNNGKIIRHDILWDVREIVNTIPVVANVYERIFRPVSGMVTVRFAQALDMGTSLFRAGGGLNIKQGLHSAARSFLPGGSDSFASTQSKYSSSHISVGPSGK